jgi:hypothetical protein
VTIPPIVVFACDFSNTGVSPIRRADFDERLNRMSLFEQALSETMGPSSEVLGCISAGTTQKKRLGNSSEFRSPDGGSTARNGSTGAGMTRFVELSERVD